MTIRLTFDHPEKEKHFMTNRMNHSGLIASFWLVGLVVLSATAAGCSSNKKGEPAKATDEPAKAAGGATQRRVVDVEPGVAGGTIEETTTMAVKVVEVDRTTRKVTLVDNAGNKATFVAGPEIRNLDQLHAGDKVTATLNERLVVYVRSGSGDGDEASGSYAAALSRAPKGAKPGGIVAESYVVVAIVTAIDATKRTATLKFADGATRTVKVRPDVDLARYKVGDNVIIGVTSALSVLAAQP
jgi:hypothetical protein